MAEIKQPQDRKPKAEKTDDYFSFNCGGETYTMPKKTTDVITTKFVRLNRRRDEIDYVFTAVEGLADDDETILDAVDSLDQAEMKTFMKDFRDHLGATLGE